MKIWNIVAFLLLLSACDKSDDPIIDTSEEVTADQMMQGLHDFQWDLFKQTVKETDAGENVSISALSVASALYMAYEGAANNTRKEMSEVLGLPNESHVGEAYKSINQSMSATGENTQLNMENSIFWDKNRVTADADFLSYMGTYHDAMLSDLDFTQPSALEAINTWVKNSTDGRIEKVLEEITDEDVMFLINALILQADWAYPFPVENTINDKFTLSDGSEVSVPMMYQDVYDLSSYKDQQIKAVELPLADTTFSMVLLQPSDTAVTIDDFIDDLSVSDIDQLIDQDLQRGRIFIHMPKFEIEFEKLMNSPLKNLGMVEAFNDQSADFSNLGSSTMGNLFIKKVIHKTYLKVDEKGVDGAAVTSVGVGVTSLPPTFRFDRPFVALIVDKQTGAQLFTAKVEDPS